MRHYCYDDDDEVTLGVSLSYVSPGVLKLWEGMGAAVPEHTSCKLWNSFLSSLPS